MATKRLPPSQAAVAAQAVFAAVLALVALSLQGCSETAGSLVFSLPPFEVGVPEWQKAPDYLVSFEFVKPGATVSASNLNSCNPRAKASPSEQCSGHGQCIPWSPQGPFSSTNAALMPGTPLYPLGFCHCDAAWADPECKTRRKSQVTAFLFAVFLGPFGADWFYLNFYIMGTLKLVTLGGFGIWWLFDIIRIGSAPVYAENYRVANDLPHWVYLLGYIFFITLIGFLLAMFSAGMHHKTKFQRQLLKLSFDEEQNGVPASDFGYGGYGSVAKEGPTKSVTF